MAEPPPIRVVFVLLPGSLVLDWAGPAEALRIANQRLRALGQPERFAIEFVGPRADAVGSVGAALTSLAPLPLRWDGPARPGWCWSAWRTKHCTPTAPRRRHCCTGCAASASNAADWSC